MIHAFGKPLEQVSIDELGKAFEGTQVGSPAFQMAIAEINKRQAVAQIEASRATVTAAAAQELAAKAQLLTARWTVVAVIVAALAVVVAAIGVWVER